MNEINIETAKKLAEICLRKAKTLFLRDKMLDPAAVTFDADGKAHYQMLDLDTEEEANDLPNVLWEMTLTASVIVVVLHSFIKESDKVPTGPLKDDPDSKEALITYVFIKGASSMRPLTFKRDDKDPDVFIFSDLGWNDFAGMGDATNYRMKNPFIN